MSIIKNSVQKIVNIFGYSLNKNSKDRRISLPKDILLNNFYENIIKSGFQAHTIVDIGANKGFWTRNAMQFFPTARFLMIEPQINLNTHMGDLVQNSSIKLLNLGVGNQNGVLKFTIHKRDDSCSFAYSEEEAKKLGLEQVKIPIKTLNTILKENNFPIPDLVKIDAEGLDYEVIEGASDILGKTEVFLVEASVNRDQYKNTLLKMIQLFDIYGYKLFEITDINREKEHYTLSLVELVFILKQGTIDRFYIDSN